MKVLLYEPGDTGHRPVILRYTIKVLQQAGIAWEHVGKEAEGRAWSLVNRAREAGCDIIYIMTVDGIAGFAWYISLLARFYGIRVICTYYLFNNLTEGWKSWVWRVLLATGNISRVHISDERLKLNGGDYPKQAWFLPDPWDPDEFPYSARSAARARLGISNSATVFMMFGALDERKGADVFLRASLMLAARSSTNEIVFLLAGKMTTEVRQLFGECCRHTTKHISWIGPDKHIPESEVSLHYYSADFVVCAYPSCFKVSSGTVTRALASGRPVIVPSHGACGVLVAAHSCGLTFASEDASAMAVALAEALRIRLVEPDKYETMGQNGVGQSVARRLVEYGDRLCQSIAH